MKPFNLAISDKIGLFSMMKTVVLLLALLLSLGNAAAYELKPELTLSDLSGKQHSLSDYRGKWILVNYWATWCPPCLEEMPELEMFHNKHKDTNAVVLGINHEYVSLEELKSFKEEQFLSFPILRSSPDKPGIAGPLQGMPTSYLIDPSGKIVAQQVGTVSREAIESFIENSEKESEGD